MTIVGFNFTRINVERKGPVKGKIGIKNNIDIKKVSPTNLTLGKNKEDGLVFSFTYKSIYEPNVGEIVLEGEVLYLLDPKRAKEVLDKWNKESKVEGAILGQVLNSALSKCNIQAVIMSKEINLPSPIPLPKLGIKKP